MNRKQIRIAIREKRNALTLPFQNDSATQLVSQLAKNSRITKAKSIAIYLSSDGELNTTPFIQWCWQNNIRTYLPVIHPFSKGHLLFIEYNQTTKMKRNIYGILEPQLNVTKIKRPDTIDIMFTPLVAFDNSGQRLGMGGGFYDRTLSRWYQSFQQNKQSLPFPIGLAHDCQKIAEVPAESWDIPIPEIITPTQHYIFE